MVHTTKLIKLLSAALCCIVTSCTSNDTDVELNAIKHTSIKAHITDFVSENAETRTLIEVSEDDKITYKWAVGDILGVFPDEGTQISFKLNESTLSADGLSATFDGGAWALKTGHSYYAYFPFSYECFDPTINKTNIPISYVGQKQDKFNDTTNAGQYDFNAAGATSSETGSFAFDFKHLGCLLRIKLTLPATDTYKSLVLQTTDAVIPVKGTVDLSQLPIEYSPTEYSSSLTIDLNNTEGSAGQIAFVYIMVPPMALNTLGKTLTATLNYGTKSTTYNICSTGTTTPNTPDFKAGTRYKRDAVFVSGDPVGNIDEGEDENQIKTIIINTENQPIFAGGFITNYSKINTVKKGIIISKCENNMDISGSTIFEPAVCVINSNAVDFNTPKDIRYVDCTNINEEEYLTGLYFLEGNTDYYVCAFIITNDNNVIYGNKMKLHTKEFNRYNGKADYGNVWYAFKNTLFDLSTDERIDPAKGFYYSTNENPKV